MDKLALKRNDRDKKVLLAHVMGNGKAPEIHVCRESAQALVVVMFPSE